MYADIVAGGAIDGLRTPWILTVNIHSTSGIKQRRNELRLRISSVVLVLVVGVKISFPHFLPRILITPFRACSKRYERNECPNSQTRTAVGGKSVSARHVSAL